MKAWYRALLTATLSSLAMPAASVAASTPFGIATPDAPAGNGIGGVFSPVLLTAIQLQTQFYQELVTALQTFASASDAGLWLVGISFLYGVLHAVGPGHGKAVVSSFVMATGEGLRQAAVLSVAASVLQALMAVAIVSVATGVFDATASGMTSFTDGLEIGSYGLMSLLGLTLVASKVRTLIHAVRNKVAAESTFSCIGYSDERRAWWRSWNNGGHSAACGCAKVAEMANSDQLSSRRQRLGVVASAGIRPCSGALIILVFAISQHLLLAGMLSVLAMAAGTACTVIMLAALTMAARGLLLRVITLNAGMWNLVGPAIQLTAGFLVLLFGMTMLWSCC